MPVASLGRQWGSGSNLLDVYRVPFGGNSTVFGTAVETQVIKHRDY